MSTRLHACLVIAAFAAWASGATAQGLAPGAPTTAPPAATPPPTAPQGDQPTLSDDRNAIAAGTKWLALIDSGKAGAAWDLSSKQLQSTVTRAKFITAMRDARKSLGKLEERTAERFARSHQLPGAPDGDYALIEYTARFAKGKTLTEHLVWKIEDGDVWRVAGYEYR
jgi:hypothetical protein